MPDKETIDDKILNPDIIEKMYSGEMTDEEIKELLRLKEENNG